MEKYGSVDEYLANFTGVTREKLDSLRETIKDLAPDAKEKIGYGIPTFTLNGKNLVHFAGYNTHIGFYPGPVSIDEFKKDLEGYKTSKGTIQFSIDKPLPLNLITKIVKACVARNQVKNG